MCDGINNKVFSKLLLIFLAYKDLRGFPNLAGLIHRYPAMFNSIFKNRNKLSFTTRNENTDKTSKLRKSERIIAEIRG